jgi:hypothetical protein
MSPVVAIGIGTVIPVRGVTPPRRSTIASAGRGLIGFARRTAGPTGSPGRRSGARSGVPRGGADGDLPLRSRGPEGGRTPGVGLSDRTNRSVMPGFEAIMSRAMGNVSPAVRARTRRGPASPSMPASVAGSRKPRGAGPADGDGAAGPGLRPHRSPRCLADASRTLAGVRPDDGDELAPIGADVGDDERDPDLLGEAGHGAGRLRHAGRARGLPARPTHGSGPGRGRRPWPPAASRAPCPGRRGGRWGLSGPRSWR